MLIDKTFQHQTVRLHTQDSVEIVLDEIPASGYRWDFPVPDNNFIEIIDDTFEINKSAGIGGGGKRRFVCVSRKKGQYKLSLRLCRPWNKSEVIDTFEFTIVAE